VNLSEATPPLIPSSTEMLIDYRQTIAEHQHTMHVIACGLTDSQDESALSLDFVAISIRDGLLR
jgi:hypothetical protein